MNRGAPGLDYGGLLILECRPFGSSVWNICLFIYLFIYLFIIHLFIYYSLFICYSLSIIY